MARPKKITDERLLSAAGAVVARLGPRFTLADVAVEAGITPGTLVHRFGSKHGLLVAMIDAAIESMRPGPEVENAARTGSVVAVRDAIAERYALLDDADAAGNNLAQLAFDLADQDLRGRMAEFYAATEAGIEPLLKRAMEAGELPGAPPAPAAARILTALADGIVIRWSARPEGRLHARLRADLDAVLGGWRHSSHT